MKDIHLKAWKIEDDRVRLSYEDGSEFFVRKSDFDRKKMRSSEILRSDKDSA